MIRFFTGLGRFGLWLASFLGGRRAGAPAAEPRRLFETIPGTEGRERTLFKVVDLAAAEAGRPAEAAPEPAVEAPARRRGRGRRVAVAGVSVPVIALVAVLAAVAYFTSTGSGSGSATVGTINAPTNVVATADNASTSSGPAPISITWDAPTTGATPSGYEVVRDDGATQTTLACSSSPCTDAAATDGTYTYKVRSLFGTSWTSAYASSNSIQVVNDTTPPYVLSIDRADANPSSASSVSWTVTFSEPVTGVDATDFTLANSGLGGTPAITTVTPAGPTATYTVTASTGTGDGTLGLDLVDNGSIVDGASNALGTSGGPGDGAFTGQVYTIDKTAPTVTIDQAVAQADPTNASPIDFTVAFSESVSSFDDTDVTLGGGAGATTAVVTGGPATYNVAVSGMTGDGTVTASIGAAKATDAAGNANTASTSTDNTVTYDTTEPTVSTINIAGTSPSNASTLPFTVTFSEPVSTAGVVAARFAVTTSNVTGTAPSVGTITPIAPSGGFATSFTVNVSTAGAVGANNGSVRLDQTSSGSIQDQATNGLTGTHNGDQSYVFDTTAPVATIALQAGSDTGSSSSDNITKAASLVFDVTFGEPVSGLSAGSFSKGAGTATGCSFGSLAGSGSSYTITASGCSEGTLTVRLAANAVSDTAGNQNVQTDGSSVTIDRTAPTTTATLSPLANGNGWNNSQPVNVTLGTGSGTDTITYSATGATTILSTTYAAPFPITAESTTTVSFYAVDPAGNLEMPDKTKDIKIDLTNPTVSAVTTTNDETGAEGVLKQAGTYYIYANASDTPSGLATVTATTSNLTTGGSAVLTTSGGPWTVGSTTYAYRSALQTATSSLTSTNGTKTYSVAATDLAGRSSSAVSGNVTIDVTAPTRSALEMFDANGNGKIDQVKATYSGPIASSTDTARWTLANVPSGGSLSSVSTTGSQATLAITEGAGAANTAAGSFTVAYTTGTTGIRDLAGNQAITISATAPADKATPVLVSMSMQDSNTNGKVDRVVATFSETLASTTLATPWTLSGVPSGGAKSTLSTSGAVATLLITEGGGAADTSVGSFTVALAADSGGIRDAAGNQSSFTATAPSDGAAPVPVALTDTDGATDGKFETGDTLTVTFSEPVTIPSSLSTDLLAEGNGSNNDTLSIPGLLNLFNTGADGYLSSGNNQSAIFTDSAIDQPALSSVRITLAACDTGASTTCTMGTELTGGTFTATPVSGIKDAADNAAAGSITKTTFRIF